MRTNPLAAGLLIVATLALTGCSGPRANCLVGYSPSLRVTVTTTSGPELSLRFCDSEQCSPTPTPGPIPAYLTDKTNEHATFVRHVARGEWNIGPRGTEDEAPNSATISLYRDGSLVTTRKVRLDWPEVDPCAASTPPPPHLTLQAP